MKKYLFLFLIPLLFLFGYTEPQPVSAADFRADEEVIIPAGTNNLEDLYLFGGNIRVDSPVTNDVVAAGGTIDILRDVSGSIIVAGGNININGAAGNTVRVAGGNIRINGDIRRDLVVTGGSISVSKDATVGRDVVVSGGNVVLDGPVQGKAIINGGNATINGTIGGNVDAETGRLTLGPNARINGNLTYSAEERAQIPNGVVQGKTNYSPREDNKEAEENARELITAGAIYKLIADILLSILFLTFFARALLPVVTRMLQRPVESGAIGFTFLLFFPLAALVFFILIWLGVAAFLFYALVFIISLYIMKIFVGWWVLRWWERRDNKQYKLDWKAGVFGPIIVFILGLIPFIGWLAIALLFLITIGALLGELFNLMRGQKQIPQKAPARTAARRK